MQEIDVSLYLLSQLSLLNKENSQQLQEVIYLFFIKWQEKVFALSSQFGTGKPLCLTAQRFFFSVDISIYYTWVLAQSIERNTREALDFYFLKQHKYETKISF